jgi:hypothetical protein
MNRYMGKGPRNLRHIKIKSRKRRIAFYVTSDHYSAPRAHYRSALCSGGHHCTVTTNVVVLVPVLGTIPCPRLAWAFSMGVRCARSSKAPPRGLLGTSCR